MAIGRKQIVKVQRLSVAAARADRHDRAGIVDIDCVTRGWCQRARGYADRVGLRLDDAVGAVGQMERGDVGKIGGVEVDGTAARCGRVDQAVVGDRNISGTGSNGIVPAGADDAIGMIDDVDDRGGRSDRGKVQSLSAGVWNNMARRVERTGNDETGIVDGDRAIGDVCVDPERIIVGSDQVSVGVIDEREAACGERTGSIDAPCRGTDVTGIVDDHAWVGRSTGPDYCSRRGQGSARSNGASVVIADSLGGHIGDAISHGEGRHERSIFA